MGLIDPGKYFGFHLKNTGKFCSNLSKIGITRFTSFNNSDIILSIDWRKAKVKRKSLGNLAIFSVREN